VQLRKNLKGKVESPEKKRWKDQQGRNQKKKVKKVGYVPGGMGSQWQLSSLERKGP